jgi:hypothetical protein
MFVMFAMFVLFVGSGVMARPALVTDEQIIEVGEKMSATQVVNAARLFKACGAVGRSERIFAVWTRHVANKQAEADADRPLPAGVPIPEKAQQLADALKGELCSRVDRGLLSIYSAVDSSLTGRYQVEMAEMSRTREACLSELRDAYGVIDELSEAKGAADDRGDVVEAKLSDALTTRHVAEALRAAAVEENVRLVERLRQADDELKRVLTEHGETKAVAARAEVAGEAAQRSLEGTTKRLQDAQAELAQAQQAAASLRDDNVRQGEALASKDLEISRLREAAAVAEASIKAWMERVLIAERPPVTPPAPLSPSIEILRNPRVRRRRVGTDPDRPGPDDLSSPNGNGSATPPPIVDGAERSNGARPPR